MPPTFRAEPYDSSATTGTIGRIMAQQGDIRANALRSSGDVKAQMLSTVGQAAGGTFERILQGRQQQKEHQIVAQVLHAAANPDGTYDLGKVQAGISRVLPDHVQSLTDFVVKTNSAITGQQTAAANQAHVKAETASTLATTAKTNAEVAGTLPETPAQKSAREAQARTQTEVARHNAAMEGIQTLTAGRAEAAQKETARHNKAMEVTAAKRADAATSDVTDLTPAGLDAAALNYAKTGQLPPLGMGDKTTRKQIINRAAAMMPDLDIATNRADFDANRQTLKTLEQQRAAVGAFEQTAQKNIDLFLTTAGKVVDSGSPIANSLMRHVTGKILGAPDQAAYDAARQVAINEIAKVTSNPTLAGTLSDSARHEVEAFNPAGATLKQTVAVMRLLKQDITNRTQSLDEQIAGIQDRIKKGRQAPTIGERRQINGQLGEWDGRGWKAVAR
jgi:hypothetical protein